MPKLKETIMELVRLYRERKRRKLMSGEAMPEEYKAGFRTASTIILICIVFPLSYLFCSARLLFGKGWSDSLASGAGGVAMEVSKALGHIIAETYNFVYYIIRSVFNNLTGTEPTAIQKDETSTLVEKFFYYVQEQFGSEGVSSVAAAMALIIAVLSIMTLSKLLGEKKTSHYDTSNPQDKSFPSHVAR
jgi:hypothetical protein